MRVNFFLPICQKKTSEVEFGLCDDTPPPNRPAYIDIMDRSKWIATVQNANKLEVIFTAIDNCIDIKKTNGIDMESRCDGMLSYEDKIIFVELKDRQKSGWLVKGEEQLRNIISIFASSNDLNLYNSKAAYVANKSRPYIQSGQMTRIQQFRNDTGFILMIQNIITLS